MTSKHKHTLKEIQLPQKKKRGVRPLRDTLLEAFFQTGNRHWLYSETFAASEGAAPRTSGDLGACQGRHLRCSSLQSPPKNSECFFGSRRKSQSPAFAFSGLGKAFAGTRTSKKKSRNQTGDTQASKGRSEGLSHRSPSPSRSVHGHHPSSPSRACRHQHHPHGLTVTNNHRIDDISPNRQERSP